LEKPIIEVKNISKMYNISHRRSYDTLRDSISNIFRKSGRKENFWALKDVSFDVTEGEVIGIIGKNGAGKSTLLKVLSRITPPTEGMIRLRGRIASLLEVGTGFHPELTGRENIFLNGAILGMVRAEINDKFDEIVEFSEIEQFLDTPVKRYSSGMYVRLAFAVAAHLEPEILLVDEVLAVGDAAFQKKCLGKMGDVAKEGRTVLFVSHNMSAIQRLCTRSLLFSDGNLILDDETQSVIQKYLCAEEKKHLEDNPLEILPRVKGLGESIRFTRCTIMDSNGEANNHVLFGEPLRFHLEAMGNSMLRDLSIIIGIDSFYESRITTIASEDCDVFFSISPEKPLHVNVELKNLVLKPGIYWITLGIRRGEIGLDHLPHVMQLVVSEVTTKGVRPESGTWGFIHTESCWNSGDDLENRNTKSHSSCTRTNCSSDVKGDA